MTPELARVKRAAKAAVELCGGVDGAAATTGKGRSTCGRWINRNDPDTPTLESALALDSIAVGMGHEPPITAAMARELGGAFMRLPDAPSVNSEWFERLGRFSSEVGDTMRGIAAALADGRIDDAERAEQIRQIDEVLAVAAEIRAALDSGQGAE
ncbi:MAG: phage regulatory CII family protein [Sphingopyxis sp.]